MHLEKNIRSILILGGTGKTGKHIVRMALEQGLRVTALTRHPDKFNGLVDHPSLEILRGDVLNYPDVYNAVQGNDAVVSTLGREGPRISVLTRGTSNIIRAIGQSSVQKLICLSSFGAGSTKRVSGWLWKAMITMAGQQASFEAKTQQELLLYQSNLDFTLVMAGWLTDQSTTCAPDPYSIQQIPVIRGFPPATSRKWLAAFLLGQVASDSWKRKTVCLLRL
jgi:putative NADH-flavin reductase